jgi:hypothetical protein
MRFCFGSQPVTFPFMASVNDFPAHGKILRIQDNTVVFAPSNTNSEIYLENKRGSASLPTGLCDAFLRVTGRKIWTVKSGGNFVDPIFGPPRKIQGRIRYLDDQQMVVHAGPTFIISLPSDPSAFDMVNGMLAVGDLVNCSILPGGTFECLGVAVAK